MQIENTNIKNIKLFRGDITALRVDAIVNAANTQLAGGGGVDGAIHRTAGPELLAECQTLGRCPTGEVRVTGAYNLSAKIVIHAVGPVWQGGGHREHELLASCYRNALASAHAAHCVSIAFPCISTGVYGFPFACACDVALAEVCRFISDTDTTMDVIFVCFSEWDYRTCADAIQARAGG